jgi:acetyl esterase/lipase
MFLVWCHASTAAAQERVPPAPVAEAAQPAARPAAPRPDQSPVVAVGSRIAWNVPYVDGGTPDQVLDVYAPPAAKDAPVVVYVHGGEWVKGDKSEVSFKPKFLTERGVVLVSINYRLSGVARHPAQADDVAAAVRWTKKHAADYGGDPARIVLLGHSAGTHLVTLVALDKRPLAKFELEPADLAGVVSWSGSNFDLVAKLAEGGDNAKYIEQNFGKAEAGLRDASPITHVGDAKPMPRFLFGIAGESTRPGGRQQAERMVELIRAAGGRAEAVTLEGKTHFTANHELGMPNGGEQIGAILLEFVKK